MNFKFVTASFCAAILSVVQSTLHAPICLILLLMRGCRMMPTEVNSIYYFYFTYLYDHTCHKNLHIPFKENDDDIVLPMHAKMSDYTKLMLSVHIILDFTWIVTAVSLLCALCCRIRGPCSLYHYFPWVFVGGLMAILDTVCIFSYAYELFKSEALSTKAWLKYVGADYIPEDVSDETDLRFQRSIIFATLIFGRCGLVVLNGLSIVTVCKTGIDAFMRHDSHTPNFDRKQSRGNSLFDNVDTEDRIRRWQEFYENNERSSMTSNQSRYFNDVVQENDLYVISKNVDDKDLKENSKYPRSLSDNQLLRSDLPWTYEENVKEITNQRNKLTHAITTIPLPPSSHNNGAMNNDYFKNVTGRNVLMHVEEI